METPSRCPLRRSRSLASTFENQLCVRFNLPCDGLPSIDDWATTFESMVFGIDLAREPIDGTMKSQEGQKSVNIKSYNIYDIQILCISYSVAGFWQLGPGSVDIVKGWTRSTAVATILIGASEVDVSDPAGLELLKPLFPVLDKVWLIPVHADWLISDLAS